MNGFIENIILKGKKEVLKTRIKFWFFAELLAFLFNPLDLNFGEMRSVGVRKGAAHVFSIGLAAWTEHDVSSAR